MCEILKGKILKVKVLKFSKTKFLTKRKRKNGTRNVVVLYLWHMLAITPKPDKASGGMKNNNEDKKCAY